MPSVPRPGEHRATRSSTGPRDRVARAALVVCVLLALAETGWFVHGLLDDPEPAMAGWLAAPVTIAIATAVLFRTAFGASPDAVTRRFWMKLAVAATVMTASVIVQAIGALLQPGHVANLDHIPRLSVVGYLVSVLMPLWALLRLPGTMEGPHERLRLVLDTTTVALGGGLFVFWFISGGSHAADNGSGYWAQFTVGLLAMVCLAAITKVLLGGSGPIAPAALRILAICMVIGGLSPTFLRFTASTPQLAAPQLTDPFIAIVIVCACMKQRQAAIARRAVPAVTRPRRPYTLLPYLAVGATDALLLGSLSGPDDVRRVVVAVCAVVVTALVVIRQMAAMRENEGLLFQLQDQREILRHRVTHDPLTKLANREFLQERVEEELARAERPSDIAVVLIDLDDFKAVNDTLGHAIGDQLLVAVAGRLRACVRPSDTVARLGGDEFAVLLAGAQPRYLDGIVERILTSFAAPITVEGHPLLVGASVGVATAHADDQTGELFRNADIAMYAAKDEGKGRYAHYTPGMHARLLQQAELAAELRDAIETGQLTLCFQPAVSLHDAKVVGLEALVRWQHPRRGLVTPDQFIPTAERTGLIVPLGRWVLQEACAQLARWRKEFGEIAPGVVGVNVAAAQLHEPDYAADVLAAVASAGLLPANVVIEVTETAVIDGGRVFETLRELRAAGVRIALDDFGTGQSSLGLLRECPVDSLKLDKSFVDHVIDTEEHAAVAAAVSHIADALGLAAIAEGIESEPQAVRLREMGYNFGQGFFFAKPLAPAEVTAALQRQRDRDSADLADPAEIATRSRDRYAL